MSTLPRAHAACPTRTSPRLRTACMAVERRPCRGKGVYASSSLCGSARIARNSLHVACDCECGDAAESQYPARRLRRVGRYISILTFSVLRCVSAVCRPHPRPDPSLADRTHSHTQQCSTSTPRHTHTRRRRAGRAPPPHNLHSKCSRSAPRAFSLTEECFHLRLSRAPSPTTGGFNRHFIQGSVHSTTNEQPESHPGTRSVTAERDRFFEVRSRHAH